MDGTKVVSEVLHDVVIKRNDMSRKDEAYDILPRLNSSALVVKKSDEPPFICKRTMLFHCSRSLLCPCMGTKEGVLVVY